MSVERQIVSATILIVFSFWSRGQLLAQQPDIEPGGSAVSAEGNRYEHRLEMSRFDPGTGARREVAGQYERVIGDKGVFLIDMVTGATLAVPNAPLAAAKPPVTPSGTPAAKEPEVPTVYPQPLSANPDEHSAAV